MEIVQVIASISSQWFWLGRKPSIIWQWTWYILKSLCRLNLTVTFDCAWTTTPRTQFNYGCYYIHSIKRGCRFMCKYITHYLPTKKTDKENILSRNITKWVSGTTLNHTCIVITLNIKTFNIGPIIRHLVHVYLFFVPNHCWTFIMC